MKLPSRVFRGLLTLAAGVLLSLMELRFFEPAGVRSLPFLLILALTVPTVFLYFRSADSVAAPLAYTAALTFLLEALGRSADVRILLACLLVLAVLFMHARLSAAASRPHAGTSAPGLTLLTVLLCGSIVMGFTFRIYRDVLQPNLPETKRFALLERRAHTDSPETPETAQSGVEQGPPPAGQDLQPALAEGAQGTEQALALKPPSGSFPVGKFLMIAAAAAVCFWAAAATLRELRYRMWLRRTLSAPPERQIAEFYRYFLRALAVCGYPRRPAETPLEYLAGAEGDGFPLPLVQFAAVTESFVSSQYGGRKVSPGERETYIALFRALPGLVRREKGRRFYCLRYLGKMHRPPEAVRRAEDKGGKNPH